MKLDQSKLKRQKQIVKNWEDNGFKGTLEATTGFGKTFTSLLGAKRLFETLKEAGKISRAREENDYLLTVVVPTDYLRNKWRADVKKHKIVKWGNVRVDTVHNLVKENISTEMLILDEIHMYVGEEAEVFPTIFNQVDVNAIFGLTATLGVKGIMRDLVDQHCPVIDTVTAQQALDNEWVADHVIYNLGIRMPEEDKKKYDKLTKKFHKHFNVFGHDLDTAIGCASDEDKARRYAIRRNYDTKFVQIQAWNFMRVMQKRKKFLYNPPVKLQVSEQIVSRFSDKKIVSFSQTTDFADELAERLGDIAVPYHSNLKTRIIDEDENLIAIARKKKSGGSTKTVYVDSEGNEYSWKQIKVAFPNRNLTRMGKKRQRTYALKQFSDNRYKVRVLSAAQAVDVGLDVEDVGMGIVNSGSSKVRQYVQRNGRIIRYAPGKQAVIVQLYIMDSQDEVWLKRRQEKRPNVKWIYSVDQIAA